MKSFLSFPHDVLHRIVVASVVLPIVGVLLTGCGGGEKFADKGGNTTNNSVTATSTDEVVVEPTSAPGKYGGIVTNSSISDPKTFNYWSAAESSSYAAAGPMLDGLIGRNSYTQEWEARLAELPKISDDHLTWTFTLKPDIKWSDGAPINADDVIFTLKAVYDEKVQTNMRESMMLDAPDGKGGFKRVPLGYRKIDDRTVEFKFPVPYAPARDILNFPIAPRHKLQAAFNAGQPNSTRFNQAWGVNVNVKDLVSSGAWILESYVPQQRLVYRRNPLYWRKDAQGRPLPYLDRFVTLIVPDTNTTTLKFRSNETDFTSIQHTDFPTFKRGEANGNYKTYDLGPSESTNYISFNMNPRSAVAQKKPHVIKTFQDVRFRRAVAHAIDRQRISDQVFLGLASPLYGPETPANRQFFNPNIAKYEFSVEKAKQLLSEMGLRDGNGNGILEMDGKDIRFNILTNTENNQRKTMAAIIQDNLRKVGLGATFTPINFNVMVAKLDAKPEKGKPYPPYDWEAIILSFGGGGVDPHNGRNIWSSSGNLHQWYPYQDKPATQWEAEIDRIFREGAQQMDEVKRREMYNRWQEIVAEQQPLVYTITPNVLYAVRTRFGNLKPSNTAGLAWNMDEWFDLKATRDAP